MTIAWARIHRILTAEKEILNLSSRRKKPRETDEKLLQQVRATDWKIAKDTEKDYQHFTEKLLQSAKKPSVLNLGKWI